MAVPDPVAKNAPGPQPGQQPGTPGYAATHTPTEELTIGAALNKAAKLNQFRQHAQAEKLLLEALGYSPTEPEALRELAVAVGGLGRPEEACAHARHALAYRPNDAVTLTICSALESVCGRHAEGRRLLDRALQIAPDLPAARWNRALHDLVTGNWERGWKDYRWGIVHGVRRERTIGPKWGGERVPGKTIFVWAEQGLGDTLMLWRFLVEVRAQSGARIIVEVQEPLAPLLIGHEFADEVYAQTPGAASPAPWDYHISLHELPEALGLAGPEAVRCPPYIRCDEQPREPGKLRVGVAWKGNGDHANDRNRSLSDAEMRPLLSTPGVEWWSLNPAQTTGLPPGTVVPELPSFEETRRAISLCDLVVSCDTSLAHLAGAMGKPLLLMLPKVGDWRWGLAGETTPWYESAVLFRQEKRGEWGPVVAQVAHALRNWLLSLEPETAQRAGVELPGVKAITGQWETSPDPDGAMIRVRWSEPDAEGRRLYVAHYPGSAWGEAAAARTARDFNESGKRPSGVTGSLLNDDWRQVTHA